MSLKVEIVRTHTLPLPELPDVSQLRIYRPSDVVEREGRYFLDVTLNGKTVLLPYINVGKKDNEKDDKDGQVWIAYANVLENEELAKNAQPEMVAHIIDEIKNNPSVTHAVTPQSSKSEAFIKNVVEEVRKRTGMPFPLIQFVGGTDKQEVASKSYPGLIVSCTSILSQAKGIEKWFGIKTEDVELIKSVGGEPIFLDDVGTTLETQKQSFVLINKNLGLPPGTLHPTVMIGFESHYGYMYPDLQKFLHIQGSIFLPEVIGPFRPAKKK